ENRRWATILEFESLRFRHIQSPDYSGLFAFLGHRKPSMGPSVGIVCLGASDTSCLVGFAKAPT
ncbi:MAG: hypothetical protein ACWA7E_19475, partial [Pseudomonas asiatica]